MMILAPTLTHIVTRLISQENHRTIILSAKVVEYHYSAGVVVESDRVDVDFQDAKVGAIGITNKNPLGVNTTLVVWLATMQIHVISS